MAPPTYRGQTLSRLRGYRKELDAVQRATQLAGQLGYSTRKDLLGPPEPWGAAAGADRDMVGLGRVHIHLVATLVLWKVILVSCDRTLREGSADCCFVILRPRAQSIKRSKAIGSVYHRGTA